MGTRTSSWWQCCQGWRANNNGRSDTVDNQTTATGRIASDVSVIIRRRDRQRFRQNVGVVVLYLAVLLILGILSLSGVPTQNLAVGLSGLVVGGLIVGWALSAMFALFNLLYARHHTVQWVSDTSHNGHNGTTTLRPLRLSEEIAVSDILRPLFMGALGFTLLNYGLFVTDNQAYLGLMTSTSNHLRAFHAAQFLTIVGALGVGVVRYFPLSVGAELILLWSVLYAWLSGAFVVAGGIPLANDLAKARRAAAKQTTKPSSTPLVTAIAPLSSYLR